MSSMWYDPLAWILTSSFLAPRILTKKPFPHDLHLLVSFSKYLTALLWKSFFWLSVSVLYVVSLNMGIRNRRYPQDAYVGKSIQFSVIFIPLHSHLMELSWFGFTKRCLKTIQVSPSVKSPLAHDSTLISNSFWTAAKTRFWITSLCLFECVDSFFLRAQLEVIKEAIVGNRVRV